MNRSLVSTKGVLVNPGDEVWFDGQPVQPATRLLYLGLHKPVRCLCANIDPDGRPLAIDWLRGHFSERLFTVGRLDFLSSGLILVTNDGQFAQRVAHPSRSVEKEYVLSSAQPVREEWLRRFQRGIRLEGINYQLKQYRYRTARRVHLVLIEGKNREIRRVFETWGCQIERLHRIRIGTIHLPQHILPGYYFHLSQREVSWFADRNRRHA